MTGFAESAFTLASYPQLSSTIAHLRDVLGDQTYETLAHRGATMTTSNVATYAYDAFGLRSSKTVGSTTTTFSWNRATKVPQLLQETAGSNPTSYVYGPTGAPLESAVLQNPAVTNGASGGHPVS